MGKGCRPSCLPSCTRPSSKHMPSQWTGPKVAKRNPNTRSTPQVLPLTQQVIHLAFENVVQIQHSVNMCASSAQGTGGDSSHPGQRMRGLSNAKVVAEDIEGDGSGESDSDETMGDDQAATIKPASPLPTLQRRTRKTIQLHHQCHHQLKRVVI